MDEETIKENKYLIDEVKQLQRLLSAIINKLKIKSTLEPCAEFKILKLGI